MVLISSGESWRETNNMFKAQTCLKFHQNSQHQAFPWLYQTWSVDYEGFWDFTITLFPWQQWRSWWTALVYLSAVRCPWFWTRLHKIPVWPAGLTRLHIVSLNTSMPVLSFKSSTLCKTCHHFHTFCETHRKSNGGQNLSSSLLLYPRETNILLTYGRLGRKAQGSNTLHNALHIEMSCIDYGTRSQRHLWGPFEIQITCSWYFIIKNIMCKLGVTV